MTEIILTIALLVLSINAIIMTRTIHSMLQTQRAHHELIRALMAR